MSETSDTYIVPTVSTDAQVVLFACGRLVRVKSDDDRRTRTFAVDQIHTELSEHCLVNAPISRDTVEYAVKLLIQIAWLGYETSPSGAVELCFLSLGMAAYHDIFRKEQGLPVWVTSPER